MHKLVLKEPSNSTHVSYYKLPYIKNLSTEIRIKEDLKTGSKSHVLKHINTKRNS